MRSFWLSALIVPAAIVGLTATPSLAQQNYPNDVIKVVVPAPAGVDILPRYFANKLAEKSKATVIVENKLGALGTIAAEYVARSKPDGYTILLTGASGTHASAKYLFKNLSYDPQKDFTPISTIARLGFVLVIDPKTPAKNVKELTAYLKSKKNVSYGTANSASILAGELYNQTAGLNAIGVPYKSQNDGLNDLSSGLIDYMWLDWGSTMEMVHTGKLRALAVSTPERLSSIPELPSWKESGLGDQDLTLWWAAFGPAGMPQPVVDKLAGWLREIDDMPETKDFLAKQGTEPFPGGPKELADYLAIQIPRMTEMLGTAKVERQ